MAVEHITWGARTLVWGVIVSVSWSVNDGMEDWWGSPEIKGEVVSRPDADGDLDLPVYNQARLLTSVWDVAHG